jgi:chemotaxis signal transduction protein
MSESDPRPVARQSQYMETRKRFFSQPMPEGYAEEWAHILEQPMPVMAKREDSMLVFRIAELPLAISSQWVKAVTPPLVVCPVPHRDNTAFLGLVAYAGEIIPCCSLARILGAADSTDGKEARTIVLEERPGERWAFPVDAVTGVSPGTLHPHEADRQMGKEWSDTLFEDDRGHRANALLPSTLFHRLQRATK